MIAETVAKFAHFTRKRTHEEQSQRGNFSLLITVILRRTRFTLTRPQHDVVALALDAEQADDLIVER